MLFKHYWLSQQFSLVHPKVREIAEELDRFLQTQGLQDMVITHVYRTAEEQEKFYWESVQKTLHCTEEIAKETARKKFSWHRVYCAIDIRNSTYDKATREKILKFLKTGRADSSWEILMHDVGRGDHFHVGYRDFGWRRKYESQPIS